MGKAVGLLLENGTIKAAEITGSGRRVRISRIVTDSMPAGEGESAGNELREFFDTNRLARNNVILCLSSADSVLRKVRFPLSNLRQIERTVKFQAEKFVLDRALEDVIVDYFIIDRKDEETEALLMVIDKPHIRDKLLLMKNAGVSPVGVTLDSVAVFNLVAVSGLMPGSGSAAILEFSCDTCRIVLAKDGKLVFMRLLNISGMEPAVMDERIARELKTSCLVAGMEDNFDEIIITGDKVPGMTDRAVTKRFGTEPVSFNPFSVFPSDSTEEENGGSGDSATVVLGAALKGIGAESVPLDFRKEEFALYSGFDFVRGKLLYLFGALVVFFGLLCAQNYHGADVRQERLSKIEGEALKYWKKIFPKKQFPLNTFDKWIKSNTARQQTKLTMRPKYRSFVESLREISGALPEQQDVVVRSISFDQKHLLISGDTSEFKHFEKFVEALRSVRGYRIKEKFEKRGRPDRPQRLIFNVEMTPLGE